MGSLQRRMGERVRGAVMQPRQVQWPPNCAGKCHTRGSRTCQSTPVADVAARDGGEVSVSRELRGRRGGECSGAIAPSPCCSALCL